MHYAFIPGENSIVLRHKDEELIWDISKIAKSTKTQSVNSLNKPLRVDLIIPEINQVWEAMAETIQDKLFGIYKDIYDAMLEITDNQRLYLTIRKKVSEIYQILHYDDFLAFVKTKSRVKYPAGLEREYSMNAPNNNLTYLKPDYTELLALVLYLRPMICVFGEYSKYINRHVSNEFKELMCMRLLAGSSIVNIRPYCRLMDYVEAMAADNKAPMEAVLKGLGTVELPEWLMAYAVVRRLPFCELVTDDMREEAHNVVSNVYNYIDSKLTGGNKSFGESVRNKAPRGNGNDRLSMEDNTSVPEGYKMREETAEGVPITTAVYLKDPHRIANLIDDTLPPDLLDKCISFINHRRPGRLRDAQLTLIQYCMYNGRHSVNVGVGNSRRIISPRTIPLLEYDDLLPAIGITQALLWHWGLYDLAALVTASSTAIPKNVFLGTERKGIHPQVKEDLNRTHPHGIPFKGRGAKQIDYVNPALKAIDSICKEMSDYAWELRCPAQLVRSTTMPDSDYGRLCPSTLGQQLASLILKVNQQ